MKPIDSRLIRRLVATERHRPDPCSTRSPLRLMPAPAMRAAMRTAMPTGLPSTISASPVCTAARISSPSADIASRMAIAARIARAGPPKAERTRGPRAAPLPALRGRQPGGRLRHAPRRGHLTSPRNGRCTGSSRPTPRSVNAGLSCAIRPTPHPSCWPRHPTSCGPGTSPSSRVRPSGPGSTCTSSSTSSVATSRAGWSPQ